MQTTTNETQRIAELNDQCRKLKGGRCHWSLTRGVYDLPDNIKTALIEKVMEFNNFTSDDDPYGEHDFGSIRHGEYHVFWKIDYYAPDLKSGSEDPTDPDKTVRVLTIILANEY